MSEDDLKNMTEWPTYYQCQCAMAGVGFLFSLILTPLPLVKTRRGHDCAMILRIRDERVCRGSMLMLVLGVYFLYYLGMEVMLYPSWRKRHENMTNKTIDDVILAIWRSPLTQLVDTCFHIMFFRGRLFQYCSSGLDFQYLLTSFYLYNTLRCIGNHETIELYKHRLSSSTRQWPNECCITRSHGFHFNLITHYFLISYVLRYLKIIFGHIKSTLLLI